VGFNGKILVIDDDDLLRMLMVSILENENYFIAEAKTGYEAEQKLSEQPYDLVILDKKLPDMNGTQLIPKIKDYAPDSKVFILSGFNNVESESNIDEEKADAYLVKPINPEELLKTISFNLKK
jgi:DNA-binding response OmpR family regulator